MNGMRRPGFTNLVLVYGDPEPTRIELDTFLTFSTIPREGSDFASSRLIERTNVLKYTGRVFAMA